jgi:tripartite-type tricarboxylate transporter receptor subunit TctC
MIAHSMRLMGLTVSFVSMLAIGSLSSTPLFAAETLADFYRGKTVRMLIGSPAGGSYDLAGRVLGRHLGGHIPGNPNVVVENMPGAASLVMANYLYNSALRDGTVIGMTTSSVPIEPKLKTMARDGGHVSFDSRRMSWIGTPDQQPQVLFVWHEAPAYSLDDLKKNKIIMASNRGADNFVLPSLMNQVLGTRMELVTGYQGSGEAYLALERGEVQGHIARFTSVKSSKPDWIRDQKVRVLALFGGGVVPELKNVPNVADTTTSKADHDFFQFYDSKFDLAFPIALPPEVPADRVAGLRVAFDETMQDPQYQADAVKAGLGLNPLSGDQIGKVIQQIENTPEEVVERLRKILAASDSK